MALPNTYQLLEYIQSSGTQYIDTGIAPSDYLVSLKIEADMSFVVKPTGSSTQSYLFGTGHYTSTAGNRRNVLVGYRGATSTTLFSYLNDGQLSNAVAFTGATLDTNRHLFVIDQPNSRYQFDGASLSFGSTDQSTNTKPILIFCARQSGSSGEPIGYYSSARLYAFKIYNNDVLIRDFVPVRRIADSVLGLYDLTNDVFYTNSGTGDFTAGADVYEISGIASPANAGTITGTGRYSVNDTVILEAVPTGRYKFQQWSDGDTNNPRTITVTASAVYTAVFQKIKAEVGGTYFLYGKKRYGINAHPLDEPPTYFTEVMSADISEDLLQRSTSTIVCKDRVTLEQGDLIFIRDERGNVIYNGFIKEVNDNTIVADQIQSFFNFSLYAMADSNADKTFYPSYTFLSMLGRYLGAIGSGHISTRVDSGGSWIDPYDVLQRQMETGIMLEYVQPTYTLPSYPYRTKNEVINGEEFLYQMYSQFEVIPYLWINYSGHTTPYDYSKLYLFLAESVEDGTEHIPPYATIDLGNNVEFIKDIEVTTTIEDANVLIIYDSTGTTYRGAYIIQTDGTYTSTFAVEDRYVPPTWKFINSDDVLTEIRDAQLKQIQHNHKVSFTFDLNNNFYDFGDINLGQNINFYVGDRLYISVLTGWSFHIENGTMLNSVRMVCGKVRNNLTSKLNLGKVK